MEFDFALILFMVGRKGGGKYEEVFRVVFRNFAWHVCNRGNHQHCGWRRKRGSIGLVDFKDFINNPLSLLANFWQKCLEEGDELSQVT